MKQNETFLENIKAQIEIVKTRPYSPEIRREEFKRIIDTMQRYKEINPNFTAEELEEFANIFAWLEKQYKDSEIKTQEKTKELEKEIWPIKIRQHSETSENDKIADILSEKIWENISFKEKINIILTLIGGKIEREKFKELSDEDFENLKKSLPAIRSIAGAILLEDLQKRWYKISIDENNKIILESVWVDDNETTQILNWQIKQNPELEKIIKEGLLFMDGNIVKFADSHTDSNGKNLNLSEMTNENYLEFLKKQETEGKKWWANKIITENPKVLEWLDLPKIAESAQFFMPRLDAVMTEVKKQNPNLETSQNTNTENQTSTTNTENKNYNPYQKAVDWIKKLDFENKPFESGLSALWIMMKDGTRWVINDAMGTLGSLPEEAKWWAGLLLIISIWKAGFLKTLLGIGGLLIAKNLYAASSEEKNSENSETTEVTQDQKDSQNERLYNSDKTKSKEQVKEIVEMVSIFYPEKLSELNAYFAGKWNNVSEELRTKLDTLNTNQIAELRKAVGEGNNGVKKLENKIKWNLKDNSIIDSIKNNITLRSSMDLNILTDAQILEWKKKMLQEILATLPEWDPQRLALEQELANTKSQTEASDTDWLNYAAWIGGGTVAVMALWKWAIFTFIKAPLYITAFVAKNAVVRPIKWALWDATVWKTKVGEKVRDTAKFALNNPVSDFVIDTAKKLDATIRFKDWTIDEIKRYQELKQKIKEAEEKLWNKKNEKSTKWKKPAEIAILNDEIRKLEIELNKSKQNLTEFKKWVKERIKETKAQEKAKQEAPKTPENEAPKPQSDAETSKTPENTTQENKVQNNQPNSPEWRPTETQSQSENKTQENEASKTPENKTPNNQPNSPEWEQTKTQSQSETQNSKLRNSLKQLSKTITVEIPNYWKLEILENQLQTWEKLKKSFKWESYMSKWDMIRLANDFGKVTWNNVDTKWIDSMFRSKTSGNIETLEKLPSLSEFLWKIFKHIK